MALELSDKAIPPRAHAISAVALLAPVTAVALGADVLGSSGPLVWLLSLIPAFLLAYYRGWRGVATALAVGMATLSITEATLSAFGRDLPDILFGVVVAYIGISLAVGLLADRLHKDRAAVEDMAFTDLLTHLPNRRHARLFLENEFAAAERGRQLSVVLFDLDHFKAYNDRHGHAAGDEALAEFAALLGEMTRRMDLSARFGGEEFVSVLAATDTEGALVFADRIRAALGSRTLPTGETLTLSAGAATYHPSMRSPDELLAAADHALYQSKHEGRNRVRLFGHTLMDHAMPSHDAAEGLRDRLGGDTSEYPRPSDEIGRTRPPLTLLPHQITGFGEGREVLVVEDDPQVRALVSTYLSREGFVVVEAPDVAAGIRELSVEFDLVVTDLRLPGAPGTDLVAAAKSRWPDTQVVVITGLHDAKVAADALNAGADQYLFKPFGMPDLRRELLSALQRRDLRAAEREERRSQPDDVRDRSAQTHAAVLRAAALLADAGETHEPYLAGHSARVQAYSMVIAETVDPGAERIDREALRYGAAFHDIGMLGVPASVVGHPGPLDSDQWARVRAHPARGRRILDAVLDDRDLLAAVTWHHERWDGTGYPDGLAGEGIPLCARVVGLCETLDAITSDRPFRPAMTWEQAMEVLRTEAGHRFDPELVAAAESCEATLRTVYDARADHTNDEADA